jgi:hypothetical protein
MANLQELEKVVLTGCEMLAAANIGARRHIESTIKDRDSGKIGPGVPWKSAIEGALAEMAVAKHFNMYMDPALGKFGEADVGTLHVRSTKWPNGKLRIGKEERVGRYILVIGDLNTWHIAGWIDAEDGRRPEWLYAIKEDRPEPNFWVPQKELDRDFSWI